MQMDELIRAIERVDSENIQDLLDKVLARYRQLHEDYTLVLISLPKGDPEEYERKLNKTMELLRKYQT